MLKAFGSTLSGIIMRRMTRSLAWSCKITEIFESKVFLLSLITFSFGFFKGISVEPPIPFFIIEFLVWQYMV